VPFEVGSEPEALAVTPDGQTVLAVNYQSGTVSLIAVPSNVVRATAKVGKHPESIILAPNGKKALVVNEGSGSMSAIDTSTGSTVGTIQVGGAPSPAALSPNGKTLVVALLGAETEGLAFAKVFLDQDKDLNF